MEDALYFPIHRAKAGEIVGVGHLSPRTRTRVRPAFEVQKQREDDDIARIRELHQGLQSAYGEVETNAPA